MGRGWSEIRKRDGLLPLWRELRHDRAGDEAIIARQHQCPVLVRAERAERSILSICASAACVTCRCASMAGAGVN
jgi:ferredoxin